MKKLDDDLAMLDEAFRLGPEYALRALDVILARREKQRDQLLDKFTQAQQELKGLRKLKPEFEKKLQPTSNQPTNGRPTN